MYYDLNSQGNWDLTDLETISLNRAGHLTSQQKARLTNLFPGRFPLLAVIFVACFLFPVWLILSSGKSVEAEKLVIFLLVTELPLCLGLAMTFYFWRRARTLRQEVQDANVVSEFGNVSQTFLGYSAKVGNRILRTFSLNTVTLLPGSYLFYFLPSSGFLLSADPVAVIEVSETAEIVHIYGGRLIFGFSEQELILNRMGKLSSNQRKILLLRSGYYGIFLLMIIAMVGTLLYFNFPDIGFDLSPASICFLTLFITPFLWIGSSFLPRFLDGVIGKNEKLTGRLYLERRGLRRESKYYLHINGQRFRVSRLKYNSLINKGIYHVYYTRFTRHIVSVEPADEARID